MSRFSIRQFPSNSRVSTFVTACPETQNYTGHIAIGSDGDLCVVYSGSEQLSGNDAIAHVKSVLMESIKADG